MNKPESPRRLRRKEKLIELLAEFGGAAQVARESGTPKSHLSAMVSGTRGLGDQLAGKLENKYGKPAGWFDATSDVLLNQSLIQQSTTFASNHPVAPASIAQVAINGVATIGQTLEQLNSLLSGVDSGTRETIANLTQESICKPDKAQANIAAIEALVRFATGKIETAAIVPATHP